MRTLRIKSVGYGKSATRAAKAIWRAAVTWRAAVDREIESLGITLAQWTVLDGTQEVCDEIGDAANQSQVARHLGLQRSTVSELMRELERLGLVSRGPSARGSAYRVILTGR